MQINPIVIAAAVSFIVATVIPVVVNSFSTPCSMGQVCSSSSPSVNAKSSSPSTSTTNTMSVSSSSCSLRSIHRILPAQRTHWVGDAFKVYPVFADMAFTEALSPFLMFDYAAAKSFPPSKSEPRGVGKHPHRGFETVTLAFQGEVEHHDSMGNGGVIGPGDIQWMTAGRGIIHEEYHSKNFTETGGVFEMCQLWVNLPTKHKLIPPKYQPILASDVKTVHLPLLSKGGGEDDGDGKTCDTEPPLASVRVIAGELGGVIGPADTFSPVQLWDVTIPKSDSVVDLPFTNGHNCIVFVRRGSIEIITQPPQPDDTAAAVVGPQAVALMEQNGDTIRIRSTSNDTSLLIMGGQPLDEPIAARGPFVMNTWEEIQQANMDYRSGRMGR